ncbi:MAG: carboxypeptidase regulatory-like domain-containing protein [Planctomycetia bacterium]|nr:carboxypeptidase regulatory-like domain-containing protein [Planctomycetia bacterium]
MRAFVALGSLLLLASIAGAKQLTGVVLTDEGTPATGATVSVAAIFHSPPVRLTTTTDKKGAFALDLEETHGSTRYALAVRWQMQGAVLTSAADSDGKSAEIRGQTLPPLLIRLRRGGRLRGKVLRDEDGGPIVGARLFLDTGEVLTSDNHGDFELTGLETRDHSLIPVSAGRVRQYVLFDTTLRPETELELRLPRGAIVKGHVLDEQGRPVSGAYITRASSGTALTLNGWDERCAADGSYEYGGLSAQRLFYSIAVEAPGYRSQSVSSEVARPTQIIQRDLRLARISGHEAAPNKSEHAETAAATEPTTELPRRTIEGVVQDDKGQPVEGVTVRWGTFLWDPSVPSTRSGLGGKYELARVPEGNGAIMVVADGFAPEFVPVQTGETERDVQLSRGASVRGVVRGTAGKPIAGVQVIPLVHCSETGFCNAIWLNERSVDTDEEGEFRIEALPVAGVMFDILKDGYSEQRNVTLKSADMNDIQLHAGGAIRGLVLDAQRNPLRNFKIRVMIPRVRDQNEQVGGYYAGFDWYGVTYTRDDGVFVLTGVGAHAWTRLIVSSPGVGRAVLDRVQAEPLDQLSAAEDLTIPLEPFTPLAVQVRDHESGDAIVDAQVALLEDESDFRQFNWGYHDLWATRTRSNSTGTAVFDEPACSDGTLLVTASGYARQRVRWTGGAQQVTITLEPAAVLMGEVRIADKLVAEGYVRLSTAAQDYFSADLQDSGGRFEFDRLPPGLYTLDVIGTGGQRLYTREITLAAGPPHVEVVTLSNKDR